MIGSFKINSLTLFEAKVYPSQRKKNVLVKDLNEKMAQRYKYTQRDVSTGQVERDAEDVRQWLATHQKTVVPSDCYPDARKHTFNMKRRKKNDSEATASTNNGK